jgi:uncharacterized YccA/Bax inhibitor family protein
MMRTANPTLGDSTFDGFTASPAEAMTVQGTADKTSILLLILTAAAAFTWNRFTAAPELAMPWLMGGAIGGFIVALVTCFKKEWSPATAPLYAALEGLVLGAVSAFYNARFPGIAFQAVLLTLGTLGGLLLAYRSGLVRATEKFKLGVVAATGGICLLYLVGFVLSFFGKGIPYIHGSGAIGIGFSVVVVVVAALNLVLDFDFIERGAEQGAPKYMEWYGAFGLLVTLVWLYLEILRLLSKLNSRRND